MPWLYLSIAILFEVVATSALKASNGFSHPGFTAISLAGYAVAIWLLSIALKAIPVGVAYAIWAGAGVAAVAVIGVVVFRQPLDAAGVIGIAMIVGGVVILQTISASGGA